MPRWSRPAAEDLRNILEYIVAEDADAAKNAAQAIDVAAGMLDRFPLLGKPGRVPGSRELPLGKVPFLLVYWEGRLGVEILRILHKRQLWPPAAASN